MNTVARPLARTSTRMADTLATGYDNPRTTDAQPGGGITGSRPTRAARAGPVPLVHGQPRSRPVRPGRARPIGPGARLPRSSQDAHLVGQPFEFGRLRRG
ncbi:hypothetical protein JCM9533A_15900 [Catenuloplanes niger JCM 9533]